MNREKFIDISKEIEWLNNNRDYWLTAIESCKIKNQERVLDLGCGYGLWSHELLKNNHNVFGVDISKECITYANYLKKEKGLSNIHFIGGSGENLPFKDGAFDLVIAVSVLQYVNRDKLFKEVTRVLKKNSLFIAILNHGLGYYLYRSLQFNRGIFHVLKWTSSLFKQIIFKNLNFYNRPLGDLYLTRSEVDSLCKKNNLSNKYVSFDHPFHSGKKKYLFCDFVISFIGKKY